MAVSKTMENNNSPLISSGTWDTEFFKWSGIQLNPSEESYNIPISANYYCIGELVFFNIHVVITNPILWGIKQTNSNINEKLSLEWNPWRFKLPFKKIDDWDISPSPTDNLSSINSYSTNLFTGRYVGKLIDKSELNMEKITEQVVTPMFGILSFGEYLYLYGLNSQSDYKQTYALKNITSEWPINFTSYNSNSLNKGSTYLRLSISGIYRGEVG